MIDLYRIVKEKRAAQAMDGQGAKTYGGRWNHPGTSMVYTSGSLSLAAHETFVHLGYDSIHLSYVFIQIQISDTYKDPSGKKDLPFVKTIEESGLPAGWKLEPPPNSTKKIGTDWALGKETAVLKVPSILIPGEFNYLLNPDHDLFRVIKVLPPKPFKFDERMIKSP